MKATHKTLALAISGAFVASIAATSVGAAENPFALKSLSSGYMVADADKMQDGKCGTGKCGANKAKEASCYAAKSTENVCGAEASCGADKVKAMKDGACGADKVKAMKDGACSADKAKAKAKEAACNH